jgi:hypothetical protein
MLRFAKRVGGAILGSVAFLGGAATLIDLFVPRRDTEAFITSLKDSSNIFAHALAGFLSSVASRASWTWLVGILLLVAGAVIVFASLRRARFFRELFDLSRKLDRVAYPPNYSSIAWYYRDYAPKVSEMVRKLKKDGYTDGVLDALVARTITKPKEIQQLAAGLRKAASR